MLKVNTKRNLYLLCVGTIPALRIPIVVQKNDIRSDDELHKSFRKLNLSPLEARLTAGALSNGVNEYRYVYLVIICKLTIYRCSSFEND